MNLWQRFKRLTFWNKLSVVGAVCSILALFGWFLFRSPETTVKANVADEVSTKTNSLARTVRTSILNDLQYSIPVCIGIQKRIMKKEFITDVDLFRSLYSPNVSLPSNNQTGVLHWEVLSALDEYRRVLTECAKHRDIYLRKLENKSYKNIEVVLLTYCIELDTVVRRGMNLVHLLDKHYGDVNAPGFTVPKYTILDEVMDDLTKAVNEAMAERGKKPNAEPNAPADASKLRR